MECPGATLIGVPFGEPDYRFLCQKVEQRFRIKLSDYKPEQMSRRIATLAKQLGCPSFAAYVGLLERDQIALTQFFDLMTINVTEFFRNSSLFEELIGKILPLIPSPAPGETFAAWSAGCSNGAEAFTVAMLLQEAFGDKPFRIKGTDIDLTMIAKASSPSFTAAELSGVSASRLDRFFSSPDEKSYVPKIQLRRNVHFARHDLLADPYPPQEYDLILCRNVVIYFNDDAKERIYEGFYKALKPGGVLFVGGTERIATAPRIGFELIRPFFYSKPAASAGLKRAA
ncbi:MAG TPA: protein-glutamate O-methyltransferase CheR [Fimbriimonadaceae bacterium]|nr:protein-glutamate O-methyltransferase CheR [Fimbriimonadaceae bacterium]